MSSARQIVGIVLVRNEDRFVRQAVENARDFCDRILIAENQSTDGTWEIVQALAREDAHIEARRISHPRESSAIIAPFAGSPTWIFGIDGDEIYDRQRLAKFRTELLGGAFDRWWVVFGNVLNCTELDLSTKQARGYLAPPCRSMTKLYNFALIDALDPDEKQRLHGANHRFKPGFDASLRLDLYKEQTWEESAFRCLHTCFLPRSSAEPAMSSRPNITESYRKTPGAILRRAWSRLLGRSDESQWKLAKYRRGELVTVDTTPFFP